MNLDQDLIDRRRPCLIGTARRTWHPGGLPAPEPLDKWCELARAAADDVAVDRDVLSEVDELGLVHCQSWAYDSPTGRLAERLGLDGVRATESILAGTSPQRLINAAAERMLLGESEVALVVGGEALATLRAHARLEPSAPVSTGIAGGHRRVVPADGDRPWGASRVVDLRAARTGPMVVAGSNPG